MARKSIVVRSPNWIGDQVMALPFYQGLRATYSKDSITLLCSENVAGLEYPGLFDEKEILPRSSRKSLRGMLSLARTLADRKFDLGLSLPSSFSSALLFFTAGIPNRVGFDDGTNLFLYTSSLRWKGARSKSHKTRLYLELLEFLTGQPKSLLLASSSKTEQSNSIIVAPGAAIALREWPYFQELLIAIRSEYPSHRILVVGSDRESKWHGFLRRMGLNIEDCVGRTNLEELRKLCESACLVIANDSGLAHVAATLAHAPTLVLFGPGDPSYVSPLAERVIPLRVGNLPCSPCERAKCSAPYGYQRCLKSLSLETVLNAVHAMLNERVQFSTTHL